MSDADSTSHSDRTSDSSSDGLLREDLDQTASLRNTPPPTSVSEPGSSSTTTEEQSEYKILREFNHGDYVFLNKERCTYFPILSPVTDSRREGGLCSYYATTDVFHTLMIIHEATRPPGQSTFFDSRFMDTPSVEHLRKSKGSSMPELQHYVTDHGLTSEEHYRKRAKEDFDLKETVLTGCRRYKTSGYRTFAGDNLHVTADCIGKANSNDVNSDYPNACINHIRRFGPVVGVFDGMMDSDLICEMDIYESKDPEIFRIDGVVQAHAVMITGYGLALHVPTGREITYYVIQNNWGKDKKTKSVGRLPCRMFQAAYGHWMENQKDLIEFSENEDTNNIVIIKKEYVEGTELPSC